VAPDFSARDHEGRTVSLKDLRGKSVVLWFYPKADTPGWTAEGCGFRDHKSEYEKKGAVILGCSFDPPEANGAFAKKFGFNFPLLTDADKSIAIAYGAADDASARSPRRVGVVIGPDGRVKHHFPKVDARGFPEEALKLVWAAARGRRPLRTVPAGSGWSRTSSTAR
jgi:thioredoxin-dependent peroxiredoxin